MGLNDGIGVVNVPCKSIEPELGSVGAMELRRDERRLERPFFEEVAWPGTESIEAGMGSMEAGRFFREGCPGLGEGYRREVGFWGTYCVNISVGGRGREVVDWY